MALDLPGHGCSGGEGRQTISGYADFFVRFIASLGLERVIPVGHSMGGAIALDLALQHPEGLAGLVLVATGARLRVLPAILEGLESNFEATVEAICGYAYGSEADERLVRLSREEMVAAGPQLLRRDFLACDRFDVMDCLGEIHLPTLIICGDEDRLTPLKYSQFLADHIQGAALVTIPEAGHMVMLERPKEVNEAIVGFLRSLSVGP